MEISKEQYIQAQKVVDDYTQSVNKKFVKPFTCICCKKNEIKPIEGFGLDNGSIKPTEQETGMWDSGDVVIISCGYGSEFDMSRFYAGICDECLKSLRDSGFIVNIKELSKEVKKEFEDEKK